MRSGPARRAQNGWTGDNVKMSLTALLTNALAQAAPAAPGAPVGGDQQWMVYAIIAFGMALALVVLEAFVPSGGVLGILAGLAAIGGIVMFWRFDSVWGMVSLGVTLVALPFVIGAVLWIAPNTPIGRALTLHDEQQRVNEEGPPPNADDPTAIAVGTEGIALTDLRPVGACKINGRRIDCIAQAGLIESGTKVKVLRVEGSSVRVKAV